MSFERKERFLFWKEVVCGVLCRLAYIGSDEYLLEWSFLAIFFVRFESDLFTAEGREQREGALVPVS